MLLPLKTQDNVRRLIILQMLPKNKTDLKLQKYKTQKITCYKGKLVHKYILKFLQ